MQPRVVDLGREDELVTWHEWMRRSEQVMRKAVGPNPQGRLGFRVTLMDGRSFAVAHMLTHVARGKCEVMPNRWETPAEAPDSDGAPEGESAEIPATVPVCNVITGYMLIGVGADRLPTTLAVPPTAIESVECVMIRPEEEPEPFGFARAIQDEKKPALEEVDDAAAAAAAAESQ